MLERVEGGDPYTAIADILWFIDESPSPGIPPLTETMVEEAKSGVSLDCILRGIEESFVYVESKNATTLKAERARQQAKTELFRTWLAGRLGMV